MYLFFLISILFICGSFALYHGQKLYNLIKNNLISRLYFLLCILFAVISLLSGAVYISGDNNLINELFYFEYYFYIIIFYILYAVVFFVEQKNDKKNIRNLQLILLIPIFYIVFFYFNKEALLNEKFKNNILSYVILSSYFFIILLLTVKKIFVEHRVLLSVEDFPNRPIYLVISLILFVVGYILHIIFSGNINYVNKLLITLPLFSCIILLGEILSKIIKYDAYCKDVLETSIYNMNQALVITDFNGKIIFSSKKFSDLFGKNYIGSNMNEFIVSRNFFENKPSEEEYYRAFLNINDKTVEVMIKYIDILNKFHTLTNRVFIVQSIKPIIEINERLRKLKRKLDKTFNDERKRLEKRNRELNENLINKESIEYQIRDIFCYDTLSGLYNRGYFMQNLEQVINEEPSKIHALMYLDLDGFKSINDSLGHSYGDEVIIEIGKRLRNKYKYKNVIASRFGGDEFVLLFRDVPNDSFVSGNAQEIIDMVKEPIYFDNSKVHLSVSIGISMYPKDGESIEDLTKNADTAMYESKEKGKGQYNFFDEKFKWRIQDEFNLTKKLVSAVPNKELILFYQPQILIKDDIANVIGFESLMRWKKDGEIRLPGTFIPVAEKTNIISDMGKWAISEACSQWKSWYETYGKKIKISINLSANQLMNPMLEDEVATALLNSQADPSCIELEITESAIVKNMKQSIAKLNSLKSYGVKISIDDFGTKYSTFSYLKELPVDKIKIDMNFIHGIGKNRIDEAIILSLISLSKELNIEIIAEGVETEEQLNFLTANGCNMIQGFYFFSALPVETVESEFEGESIINSQNIFEMKQRDLKI
ncbi:putative phage head-tail adaptor [[Eubacterium] yurii subsp. margaretiae ATCC 43715]|nr:putative phage head-tail adaptor [[Eubacterium] yurii subsp. margaretiae ATCC 43715]